MFRHINDGINTGSSTLYTVLDVGIKIFVIAPLMVPAAFILLASPLMTAFKTVPRFELSARRPASRISIPLETSAFQRAPPAVTNTEYPSSAVVKSSASYQSEQFISCPPDTACRRVIDCPE